VRGSMDSCRSRDSLGIRMELGSRRVHIRHSRVRVTMQLRLASSAHLAVPGPGSRGAGVGWRHSGLQCPLVGSRTYHLREILSGRHNSCPITRCLDLSFALANRGRKEFRWVRQLTC